MITATEAFQISRQANPELNERYNEIQRIEEVIREAAKQGYTSITWRVPFDTDYDFGDISENPTERWPSSTALAALEVSGFTVDQWDYEVKDGPNKNKYPRLKVSWG